MFSFLRNRAEEQWQLTAQQPATTYGSLTTTTSRAGGSAAAEMEEEAAALLGSSSDRIANTESPLSPSPSPSRSAAEEEEADGDHGDETRSQADEEEDFPASHASDDDDDDTADALAILARRLRCLFSVVTWPIVPLGSLCIIGILWLAYASFILERHATCSHPLEWYSITSLIVLVYLPFHTTIRSALFRYDQDRDGPDPPAVVRRYDQCIKMIAVLYVYAGITMVQTCQEDLGLSPDDGVSNQAFGGNHNMMNGADGGGGILHNTNTCAATCPQTFSSLRIYVACLELFFLSLIAPLLFLPCLYLYFVRRTMEDAEALTMLQDRFREEEAVRRNGGVTAESIMKQLQVVHLVVDPRTIDRKILVVPALAATAEETSSDAPSQPAMDWDKALECDIKECCICMKNFAIEGSNDIETGQLNDSAAATAATDNGGEDCIVRTTQTCSHLFHQRCLASWVGGRWEGSNSDGNASPEGRRRARHTTYVLSNKPTTAATHLSTSLTLEALLSHVFSSLAVPSVGVTFGRIGERMEEKCVTRDIRTRSCLLFPQKKRKHYLLPGRQAANSYRDSCIFRFLFFSTIVMIHHVVPFWLCKIVHSQ
jgi:hypothetical protein